MPHVTAYTEDIKKITAKGFMDQAGVEHEVDVIICATGFNTSWVPRFPIEANGKNVQDLHASKALSYLSVGVPDSELRIVNFIPFFPYHFTHESME